jgi:CheY-like chemotaxis protein
MAASQPTPKSILIVDDEQDVSSYLAALLSDAGYETRVAANGQQAMDAVKTVRPDLISLDITMPEKSGVRFYREMREDEALSKIPIVIVTGVTNPWASPGGGGTIQDFLSKRRNIAPPDGFFEKPVDKEAYLARIAELA